MKLVRMESAHKMRQPCHEKVESIYLPYVDFMTHQLVQMVLYKFEI